MVKILFVEDDAMVSRMYKRVFEASGCEVEVAENGMEGLEKLKKGLPDIIVTDLMMPEMNGMDFLEKVKADAKTKSVPVVILTNLAGENDVKYGLSKGAIKYIIKSQQEPEEVVEMIKRVMEHESNEDVVEEPQAS